MSLQLTELVKRPGAGKSGKPVRVRANFFEVTAFATQNIHHYDVTIDPADTKPALVRKVWSVFEETNGQGILTNLKTIFDGRKNVFSPKPLNLGEEQAKQFEVKHDSDKYFFFF
jgi:eukaryotic translation initiation factor 2C